MEEMKQSSKGRMREREGEVAKKWKERKWKNNKIAYNQ
jgi:hypothetical protein